MPAKPRPVLNETDRLRIGNAREVLQEYGLYVDVADMSDVAYERRNTRMKALDVWASVVDTVKPDKVGVEDLLACAAEIENYIWEGRNSVPVQD